MTYRHYYIKVQLLYTYFTVYSNGSIIRFGLLSSKRDPLPGSRANVMDLPGEIPGPESDKPAVLLRYNRLVTSRIDVTTARGGDRKETF